MINSDFISQPYVLFFLSANFVLAKSGGRSLKLLTFTLDSPTVVQYPLRPD